MSRCGLCERRSPGRYRRTSDEHGVHARSGGASAPHCAGKRRRTYGSIRSWRIGSITADKASRSGWRAAKPAGSWSIWPASFRLPPDFWKTNISWEAMPSTESPSVSNSASATSDRILETSAGVTTDSKAASLTVAAAGGGQRNSPSAAGIRRPSSTTVEFCVQP